METFENSLFQLDPYCLCNYHKEQIFITKTPWFCYKFAQGNKSEFGIQANLQPTIWFRIKIQFILIWLKYFKELLLSKIIK